MEVDLGKRNVHGLPTPLEVWDETPVVITNEISGAGRTVVQVPTDNAASANNTREDYLRSEKTLVIGTNTELGYVTPNIAALIEEYSNVTGEYLDGKEKAHLFGRVTQENGLYAVVDYLLKDRKRNFDSVKKDVEGLGVLNEFRKPLLAYLFLVKNIPTTLPLSGQLIKDADRQNVQKALRSRSNMRGYDAVSLLRKGKSLAEALEISDKTSKVAIAIEKEIDNGLAKSKIPGDKEKLNLLEKVLLTAKKLLPVVEKWRISETFIRDRQFFVEFKRFVEAISDTKFAKFGNELKTLLTLKDNLDNSRFAGVNGYLELFKELSPYETVLLNVGDDKNPLTFEFLVAGDPTPQLRELHVNDFTLMVVNGMAGYIDFKSELSLQFVERIQEYSKALGELYAATKDHLETVISINPDIIQTLGILSDNPGFNEVLRGCRNIGKVIIAAKLSNKGPVYSEFETSVNEYNETIDPLNTASDDLDKALAAVEQRKSEPRGYLGAAVLSAIPSGSSLVEPIPDPRLIEFTNKNFTIGELFTRRVAVKTLGLWKAIANTRIGIDINELRQPELSPGAVVSLATSLLLMFTYVNFNRQVESRNATRVACLSVLPSQGLGYLTDENNLVGNDALQVRSDFNSQLNPFVEDMKTGEFKTSTLRFVEVLDVFGAPSIRKKTYSLPSDMETAVFRGLVATAIESQKQSGIVGESLTSESKSKIERMYKELVTDTDKALEMWKGFYTVDNEIAPGTNIDGIDANGNFDKDKRIQIRTGRIKIRVDAMKANLDKGFDFNKAIDDAMDSLAKDCR